MILLKIFFFGLIINEREKEMQEKNNMYWQKIKNNSDETNGDTVESIGWNKSFRVNGSWRNQSERSGKSISGHASGTGIGVGKSIAKNMIWKTKVTC